MANEDLEIRMFGMVPYNISEIQKGIQFGHGVIEYSNMYFNDIDYQSWARKYKTFIILNGGTSMSYDIYNLDSPKGSMESLNISLYENNIKFSKFNEPDLNYMLSSINFLVDERVFNKKKYPDFKYNSRYLILYNKIKSLLSDFDIEKFNAQETVSIINDWMKHIPNENNKFNKWLESIGGVSNFYLRIILDRYSLA